MRNLIADRILPIRLDLRGGAASPGGAARSTGGTATRPADGPQRSRS
jgi:hypothetical protein